MATLHACLAEGTDAVAEEELNAGAREIGGNNLGPYVAKYLKPSGLKPPQPWCAAFVSWCLTEVCHRLKVPPVAPYFVSAKRFLAWGRMMALASRIPRAGSLAVWHRGDPSNGLGHIGIVTTASPKVLTTIEGTRGPRVGRFNYEVSSPAGSAERA